MKTSDPQIRGKILFRFNTVDHRFGYAGARSRLDGVLKPWDLHTDFQTVLDTIAYAKKPRLETHDRERTG